MKEYSEYYIDLVDLRYKQIQVFMCPWPISKVNVFFFNPYV